MPWFIYFLFAFLICSYYYVFDFSISHRLTLKEVVYSITIPSILYILLVYYSLYFISVAPPSQAKVPSELKLDTAAVWFLTLLWSYATLGIMSHYTIRRFYKEYDLSKGELKRRLRRMYLLNYKKKLEELKPYLRK